MPKRVTPSAASVGASQSIDFRDDAHWFTSLCRAVRSRRQARVTEQIADALGLAILTGKWQAGALLPAENDTRSRLEVSPAAYRAALRILTGKGLLESTGESSTGESRTRVASRDRWQLLDADVLRWTFESAPNEEVVQEVFELRDMLEPYAAELAAKRRSVDQLSIMRDALEELARFGLGTEQGRAADRRFHEQLFLASGNRLLAALSDSIGSTVELTTLYKLRSSHALRDPVSEHTALYTAILEGDTQRANAASHLLIHFALEDTRMCMRAIPPGTV